ncbi:glycoside hydrolase domain-containing protein [Williamsia sterculiae]|uniref:Rv2525c-like glycoside hydrolase-like domain-containing protein n=1 Tax=Williamsia sterculiae TaxID=1344003 RepID=A0A1N7G7N0_9NOCA|nr:glycoside hydrolase domain-containing protein [Williamsia sterculiae]SIS08591.1 protein of unknown function [Williamsia sterculiae]
MPRGLDYAGGRPSGAAIRAAGYDFVCRYLTDGGTSLPGKQLLPDEVNDLVANAVGIVANFETYADRMLEGRQAGIDDATFALARLRQLPHTPSAPVVYYSADFDTTPEQQNAVNDYLRGAASVHGSVATVGVYGGFWTVSRALDAGVATYAWQTQAWSGTNVDPRIALLQRNDVGYVSVDGVQCDVDETRRDDYGKWPA